MEPILTTLLFILISFFGFALHIAYTSITCNLKASNIFCRLRKVTLLFAVLSMLTVWLALIIVNLDLHVNFGPILLLVFCVSVVVNLAFLLVTPLNKQCRYRIADLARHRNSKIAFAFLVTLLGVLWMIAKIVAKFFYHALKGTSVRKDEEVSPYNFFDHSNQSSEARYHRGEDVDY